MRKQTKKWKTKFGEKIRICDMSDNHLLNAIRYLERFAKNQDKYIMSQFDCGCPFQGEEACDAWDAALTRACNATWDDYLPEIYTNLMWEVERRGLKIEKTN